MSTLCLFLMAVFFSVICFRSRKIYLLKLNIWFTYPFRKKRIHHLLQRRLTLICFCNLFQQPSIATAFYCNSLYFNSILFTQPSISTAFYFNSLLFQQPSIATAFYFNSLLFQQPSISTAFYCNSLLFRQPSIPMANYFNSF